MSNEANTLSPAVEGVQPTIAVHSFLDREIGSYLQEVDYHLRPYMIKAARRVPAVHPLHEGVSYQINTGGKRMRAALCVTSCAMFCGSIMRAMNFAATIEHLQNFMLDHDDIADEDEERRMRESIWKKYGIGHGVNIGDVFVTLSAYSILTSPYVPEQKVRLIQLLSELGLEIAEGQCLDINLKSNDSPVAAQYVECTKKKTGSFFAMAIIGGAMIGGAGAKYYRLLYDFSTLAGVAFQIKDDLIDVNGVKGRARGSDVREGKRTLLSIYAAHRSDATDRVRLFSILNTPRAATNDEQVMWVLHLYESTGAIEYAEKVADRILRESIEYLADIPESEAKRMLLKISDFICARKR